MLSFTNAVYQPAPRTPSVLAVDGPIARLRFQLQGLRSAGQGADRAGVCIAPAYVDAVEGGRSALAGAQRPGLTDVASIGAAGRADPGVCAAAAIGSAEGQGAAHQSGDARVDGARIR